jgi:hypothetical protein
MIHRVVIERDTNWGIETDPGWGDDDPAWADHIGGAAGDPLACRWWAEVGRGEVVAADRAATLRASRMMVPADADIRTSDRVARIENRLGVVLVAGPLDIEQVIPRSDHLLVMLTQAGPAGG